MTTVKNRIITITGASGSIYSFEVYPKSYGWNEVPGIYLVLKKKDVLEERYDPIYVGETENLNNRFSGHHKAGCFESYRWTHLAFLYEGSNARRLFVEQDILSGFSWPCNG